VLRILEADLLSARMAASMAEVDHTVTTWPQLAGDVNLGASLVGAAICRLGLGEPLSSGRVRVDLARSLADLASPKPATAAPAGSANEQDTPAPDDITAVLAAAVLAPSGGNSQPWIFETTDSEIRLFVDPQRTSGMDVALRGSYVAVGAALFNARVAASARGRSGSYRIGSAELGAPAATLELGRSSEPELSDLYAAVMARGTNRRQGVPQALAGEARAVLRHAVEREGCHLQVIDHPAKLESGAEILAASDRIRFLDQALHAEMMSELKWPGRDDLRTGIDVRTLDLDAADLAKLEVARRGDVMRCLDAWNGGRGLGDVTRRQLSSTSALALVAVDGASPASYVRGGMAVERFWVCAAGQGLALQPVSPVFLYAQSAADHRLLAPARASELEALSAQMLQLFAVGPGQSPVLVLRLSHAPPASQRSRRLPLDAVRRSHDASCNRYRPGDDAAAAQEDSPAPTETSKSTRPLRRRGSMMCAGAGRAKRYPCPRRQPRRNSSRATAASSIPSATRSRPNAAPSPTMASITARSMALEVTSATKLRSILSTPTGSHLS